MNCKLWLSVLQNIGTSGALHAQILGVQVPGLTVEWLRQHAGAIASDHALPHLGPVVALMIHETDPAAGGADV